MNNNTTKTNQNVNNNQKINNKATTRIKDWGSYNDGMMERGRFKELAKLAIREIEKETSRYDWKHHKAPGRPKKYPDALILVIAVYREIFNRTFREVAGFAKDIFNDFGIEVPDYTTIGRRMAKLDINFKIDKRRLGKNISILIDSTGYKITGEGEWKTAKHGRSKKRIFVKVHYATDYKGEQILGLRVTVSTRGDNLEAPAVLEEVTKNIGNKIHNVTRILGDGAYNTKALKRVVEDTYNARLIAPPKVKPNKTKEERNRISQTGKEIYIGANEEDNNYCNKNSRADWKNKISYHDRSLAETNMFRLKSPFGDKLSCRTIKNQIIQIKIRAMILNMWTNEWMPKYTKSSKSKTKP